MKTNRYSVFLIFLLVLVFSSCKKEEIHEIPESNSPLFTMSGSIGNDSLSCVVGDDNSIFTSSLDWCNGVKLFNGRLTKNDLQVEIGLFDGNLDKTSVSMDELKSITEIKFAEMSGQSLFNVNRSDFENANKIKEINWTVNGVYMGKNQLSISNPGKYEVCANIVYLDQTEKNLCNEVILGFKKNAGFGLQYYLNASNNQLVSWISASEGTISSVRWFLNGEQISNVENLQTVLGFDLYELKAEVEFTNGVKRTRSILVDAGQQHKSIEDFAINENFSDISWDYKPKIKVTKAGNEYSSIFADNENNTLKITSIDFYDNDSNGNPVYIVKASMSAKVKSKTTNEFMNVNLKISWGLVIK